MTDIAAPGRLATIVDALTARLQLVFPTTLFVHELVPARLTKENWKLLTRKAPFIGIGWNDVANDEAGGRLFTGESHFSVFLVTKNASGIRGRYFGDARAPGLFMMVEAATAILNGFTIAGCGTAFVKKASNVYVEGWDDEDMVVSMLDVDVGITLKLADTVLNVNDEGWFNTLGIDWNFDGSTTVLSDIDQVRTQ